ncbi:MAG: hypothetical protein PHD70_06870 [Anaerostipes sp.]|nr:hypothetical protein [Anaerostipes sp.]
MYRNSEAMFRKKHLRAEFDKTAKFEEIILICNGKDLDTFMEEYDVSLITKEW